MRVPMRTWVSGLVGSALLGLGMLGCDGKPSVETSTTEAKVKGTVTIKGKVATKGKVVFDPSNYKRKNESVRQADISADGTYEITTLIGPNTVKVDSAEAAKAASLYETYVYDVPAGESTFDIKIPKDQ